MTADLDASRDAADNLTQNERAAAATSDLPAENWINGRWLYDHEMPDPWEA